MQELSDQEILEFLLTSDFNDEYKPSEYKYLLYKFRSFYKVMYARKYEIEGQRNLEIRNSEENKKSIELYIEKILKENADLKNQIDTRPKEKKLTFSERFFGKVKL